MPRYFAADMLRDLIDLGEDEAAAGLQIARIVDQLIETHCRLNRRWPRSPSAGWPSWPAGHPKWHGWPARR